MREKREEAGGRWGQQERHKTEGIGQHQSPWERTAACGDSKSDKTLERRELPRSGRTRATSVGGVPWRQQERQTCEDLWGGILRGQNHEQQSCEEGDIARESNSGKAPAGAARDNEGQTSTIGGIRQQTQEPARSNVVWEEREHTRAISAGRHRPRGRIVYNSAEVGVGVAFSRHVRMRECGYVLQHSGW